MKDETVLYHISLAPENQALLQRLALGSSVDRPRLELRLRAEELSLVQGFDVLLAPHTVRFTPFPYQLETAAAVLRRFRGRAILGDEVGLGKTIEAGLVLKEYLLRGLVQRILIVTPPALVKQWQEELAQKFGLDFTTHEDEAFRDRGAEAWAVYPQVIASLATARREPHSRAIRDVDYDLIIVDEAHHLKSRQTQGWQFVNDLKTRYVLLLTATPVQNNLEELYNLVTLLQPGQLKTSRDFKKEFVTRGDPRLPRNRLKLRELLADVMIRNTRAGVHLGLPKRQAVTVKLQLTPPEAAFYHEVGDFVRQTMAQTAGRSRTLSRLALQTLLMEAGSSPFATVPTLQRMAVSLGDAHPAHAAHLRELAHAGREIADSAKAMALLKLLHALPPGPEDKVIIFSKYLETLHYLTALLRQAGWDPAVYHGSLPSPEKDAVIADFHANRWLLLCTEAAGEGRNLQFCHTMINYDLPWNPLRIEQRVGRLHRIGQEHEVTIYNLAAQDTLEAELLHILDQKISMFELVIGEMDMILGNLADEREFEDILLDLYVQSPTPEDVKARMADLGEALAQARQVYLQTKAYDETLFGEEFRVDR